jgi:hypothetical protein
MHELTDPIVRLDPPSPSRTDALPGLQEADERLARRELRRQIASMESELGALHSAAYPRRQALDFKVSGAAGPRVLGLADLEALRDTLAARVSDVRRSLVERGYAAQKKRALIQEMLVSPERHKWVRVSNEDIGEPGCRHWHAVPRLGPIGMLMGWWRVKVSSGCP